MTVIISVVLPIFAIILCGFLAGRFSWIPVQGASTLNAFVFNFALPALLFLSISTAPVQQITNKNFILANVCIVISCYILTFIIFKLFYKKRLTEATMYGMITTYGNTGFLGIPLLIAAFGQEAAVPVAIATFIYDITILTIVITSFEWFQTEEKTKRLQMIKKIMKAILINPINASLILGLAIALLQVPLPESVVVFMDVLGPAAGPTALFALGLGLSGQRNVVDKQTIRVSEFGTLLLLKLGLLPILAFYFITIAFPVSDQLWTTSVIVLSALPTGALVNVFAQRYQTLTKEAPLFILTSTLLSIGSLSFFLVWLI